MFNAFSTADLIAADLAAATTTTTRAAKASRRDVDDLIETYRGDKRVVDWSAWEQIDRVEKERGRAKGKLREKITSVEEMLKVIE